jgi:acetoacetyl-CoA synthetase
LSHQTPADPIETFRDLQDYSVSRRADFWSQLFSFSALIHEGTYARAVDESLSIEQVPTWFEGVRLNFAENMLFSRHRADPPGHRGTRDKEDAKVAITEVREAMSSVRDVTWEELRRRAGELAAAMKRAGIEKGDRVVIVGANSIETCLVWLASNWLGAIFSSSSTDMGVNGILQRTVQVNPKVCIPT